MVKWSPHNYSLICPALVGRKILNINFMRIDQKRLKELVEYNPITGEFTRKSNGMIAGYPQNQGYLRFRLDGRTYLSHRLAWLFEYGRWPDFNIDHINGVVIDNRIVNLREATHSQNAQNEHAGRKNKTGFRGVQWSKHAKKWLAKIIIDGKCLHIGYFKTAEEAGNAYLSKKKDIHPFANF